MTALSLETYRLGKRFGSFTALADVSIRVRPGTVHALLGENFIKLYLSVKRLEYSEYMKVISPWERRHLLLHV